MPHRTWRSYWTPHGNAAERITRRHVDGGEVVTRRECGFTPAGRQAQLGADSEECSNGRHEERPTGDEGADKEEKNWWQFATS
jgi:hypothetical protein